MIQQVVYAESMRQSRGNGDVQMPLVNNWTVDDFNKLEEDRLSPKNVEVKTDNVEVMLNSFENDIGALKAFFFSFTKCIVNTRICMFVVILNEI